jgi:integrase
MGRPRKPVPTYRHHKFSNQAVVTLGGRDVYLGVFESPASIAAYARLCAELQAGAAQAAVLRARAGTIAVNDLVEAFWAHAQAHYRRRDGTPTNEVKEYKQVIRRLREHHGCTLAGDFGPIALQTVRRSMIAAGWCRTRVNKQVGRLRRIFRWAVAQELIPVGIVDALDCVEGLQRGRTDARESDPVEPVDWPRVDATLPHLWPTLQAMVRLQRFTGMRPGEVRLLSAAEIDRSGKVWVYQPDAHKMAYLDRGRFVPIGPRGQEVLEPHLSGAKGDTVLFSPVQAREERFTMRRAARKSKVPPSQVNRRMSPEKLQKQTRDRFTNDGYAACVRRACLRAGVDPWHPNQIRHSFATDIRARYGLEAAQVLLGHARADVTQMYAARDLALALRVAEEVG